MVVEDPYQLGYYAGKAVALFSVLTNFGLMEDLPDPVKNLVRLANMIVVKIFDRSQRNEEELREILGNMDQVIAQVYRYFRDLCEGVEPIPVLPEVRRAWSIAKDVLLYASLSLGLGLIPVLTDVYRLHNAFKAVALFMWAHLTRYEQEIVHLLNASFWTWEKALA